MVKINFALQDFCNNIPLPTVPPPTSNLPPPCSYTVVRLLIKNTLL